MERYAWKATIKDGTENEYIRRHSELWAELAAVLKEAGIRNYSIWLNGNELFGYYECAQGIRHAAAVQAGSPVVERWNNYMADILVMETDPLTGAQPMLQEVFYFS